MYDIIAMLIYFFSYKMTFSARLCQLENDKDKRWPFGEWESFIGPYLRFKFTLFYKSYLIQKLKRKKRTYYCKIIQMLVIGLLVTFGFLIGIILLFSYSKFHELLNDLKKEVDNKSKQNQNDLNDLKRQIVEYDQLFKQVNHLVIN